MDTPFDDDSVDEFADNDADEDDYDDLHLDDDELEDDLDVDDEAADDSDAADDAGGAVDADLRSDAVPVAVDSERDDLVDNARRRYGTGGAFLAAGMFGLDIALGRKQKPDSVQVQEASSEPLDVDKTGIQLMIDELTSVEAPPLERREPLGAKKRRSRRR